MAMTHSAFNQYCDNFATFDVNEFYQDHNDSYGFPTLNWDSLQRYLNVDGVASSLKVRGYQVDFDDEKVGAMEDNVAGDVNFFKPVWDHGTGMISAMSFVTLRRDEEYGIYQIYLPVLNFEHMPYEASQFFRKFMSGDKAGVTYEPIEHYRLHLVNNGVRNHPGTRMQEAYRLFRAEGHAERRPTLKEGERLGSTPQSTGSLYTARGDPTDTITKSKAPTIFKSGHDARKVGELGKSTATLRPTHIAQPAEDRKISQPVKLNQVPAAKTEPEQNSGHNTPMSSTTNSSTVDGSQITEPPVNLLDQPAVDNAKNTSQAPLIKVGEILNDSHVNLTRGDDTKEAAEPPVQAANIQDPDANVQKVDNTGNDNDPGANNTGGKEEAAPQN